MQLFELVPLVHAEVRLPPVHGPGARPVAPHPAWVKCAGQARDLAGPDELPAALGGGC
jgi:hypothetical protein